MIFSLTWAGVFACQNIMKYLKGHVDYLYLFILGTFFVLHDCWNFLKSWPSRRPATRSSKSRNSLPMMRAKMKQKGHLYGRTPECHWSNCITSVGLQIVFTGFVFLRKLPHCSSIHGVACNFCSITKCFQLFSHTSCFVSVSDF